MWPGMVHLRHVITLIPVWFFFFPVAKSFWHGRGVLELRKQVLLGDPPRVTGIVAKYGYQATLAIWGRTRALTRTLDFFPHK
jgi:hypothetical protein